MKLQQSISKRAKQQWIGRELVILAEGESEETPLLWEGRTEFHAPEIDGKVYINDFGDLETLERAASTRPRSPMRMSTTWWRAWLADRSRRIPFPWHFVGARRRSACYAPAMANPEHLAKLREGASATAWNEWRKQHPGEKIDLSGAVFESSEWSGIALGRYNLRGANLREVKLRSSGESRADLAGADLRDTDLSGAELKRADLTNAKLARAVLAGAELKDANLCDAILEKADLHGADLSGANATGAHLSKANLESANLKDATLVGADLSEARLWKANLSHARLAMANLRSADLRDAYAVSADLGEANLNSANLRFANLSRSNLSGADLARGSCRPCRFERSESDRCGSVQNRPDPQRT